MADAPDATPPRLRAAPRFDAKLLLLGADGARTLRIRQRSQMPIDVDLREQRSGREHAVRATFGLAWEPLSPPQSPSPPGSPQFYAGGVFTPVGRCAAGALASARRDERMTPEGFEQLDLAHRRAYGAPIHEGTRLWTGAVLLRPHAPAAGRGVPLPWRPVVGAADDAHTSETDRLDRRPVWVCDVPIEGDGEECVSLTPCRLPLTDAALSRLGQCEAIRRALRAREPDAPEAWTEDEFALAIGASEKRLPSGRLAHREVQSAPALRRRWGTEVVTVPGTRWWIAASAPRG